MYNTKCIYHIMRSIRPKGIIHMIYRKEISLDQRWSQGYTVDKNIRKYIHITRLKDQRLTTCAKVKLKTLKTLLRSGMHAVLTRKL